MQILCVDLLHVASIFFFNCQFISQNVSIGLAKKGPFHKRLYIYCYVIDAKQTQTDTYLISNTLKPPDVSAANELKNTLKIDVILMFCIGFCARRFFFLRKNEKILRLCELHEMISIRT